MSLANGSQSARNSSELADAFCLFPDYSYKHNWRYHKELRLWLTKEAGSEPIQKTATYERGSYM